PKSRATQSSPEPAFPLTALAPAARLGRIDGIGDQRGPSFLRRLGLARAVPGAQADSLKERLRLLLAAQRRDDSGMRCHHLCRQHPLDFVLGADTRYRRQYLVDVAFAKWISPARITQHLACGKASGLHERAPRCRRRT